MAGSQLYNLGYFTECVTIADKESFRDSDKNRFFQFYPQDSLTTVAMSKVRLTGMKKDTFADSRLFQLCPQDSLTTIPSKVHVWPIGMISYNTYNTRC